MMMIHQSMSNESLTNDFINDSFIDLLAKFEQIEELLLAAAAAGDVNGNGNGNGNGKHLPTNIHHHLQEHVQETCYKLNALRTAVMDADLMSKKRISTLNEQLAAANMACQEANDNMTEQLLHGCSLQSTSVATTSYATNPTAVAIMQSNGTLRKELVRMRRELSKERMARQVMEQEIVGMIQLQDLTNESHVKLNLDAAMSVKQMIKHEINTCRTNQFRNPRIAFNGDSDASMDTYDDLPDGWDACIDPKSKRVFFVNHIDELTTWVDPRTSIRNSNLGLPRGWTCETDVISGKIYYVHHPLKRTTRRHPLEVMHSIERFPGLCLSSHILRVDDVNNGNKLSGEKDKTTEEDIKKKKEISQFPGRIVLRLPPEDTMSKVTK